MTYGWVQDQVLKLLNQYSIGGTNVPITYNNQADFINRIPSLVNDAIMEIATTAKKIPASVELTELYCDEVGEYKRYRLPQNFYQFQTGSVIRTADGRRLHTNHYRLEGRDYVLIPKDESGDYTITYYRYPALVPESASMITTPDEIRLDNTDETHMAIPFYVASFLLADSDAFRCSLFYNKYEDKLAKMSAGISAEAAPVEDIYATNWSGSDVY